MTRLQGSNQTRMLLVLGTLIAAALIALALFAVRGQNPATGDGKSADFDLAALPFTGQADAKVSMVVVEDFKCPACKQFEEAIYPELKAKYVDSGQVKAHMLVMPFIAEMAGSPEDDSKLAGQAALCVYDSAGGDAFSTFKAILFRAQGGESEAWASKTRLKELAANVEGLDQAAFTTCLDTDATAARVDAMEAQAKKAGVNSTPTIFVNGKQVMAADGSRGSYLAADVSKAIDEALK